MGTKIQSVLYIDPQSKPPAGFCKKCLGALYAPSMICLRCQRDVP